MKRPTTAVLVCALIAGTTATLASESIDASTKQALLQALDDERLAAATYAAVIDKHGEILPFANIVGAEHRHIGHLLDFFERYELEIPDDRWAGKSPEVPATVQEACREAIAAEKRNVALYDEILPNVTVTEIRDRFAHLQQVSQDRHLPAFERCSGRLADETTRGGCCGKCGKGRGNRAQTSRTPR